MTTSSRSMGWTSLHHRWSNQCDRCSYALMKSLLQLKPFQQSLATTCYCARLTHPGSRRRLPAAAPRRRRSCPRSSPPPPASPAASRPSARWGPGAATLVRMPARCEGGVCQYRYACRQRESQAGRRSAHAGPLCSIARQANASKASRQGSHTKQILITMCTPLAGKSQPE